MPETADTVEPKDLDHLRQHPLAKVTRWQKPPLTDSSLVLINQEIGIPKAETLRHLNDNGTIKQWTDQNAAQAAEHEKDFHNQQEPEDDVTPFVGSGFITSEGDNAYVISNRHVLERTEKRVETLMSMHTRGDVAAAPGELVERCPGDPYDLPFVSVSKLQDAKLEGRTVVIQGMGQSMLSVEGQVLNPTSALKEAKPGEYEGQFCLVVPVAQMKDFEAWGLSGSRVEDKETKEVVGVFHSTSGIEGLNDRFLMQFTGPDTLRKVLAEAERRRQRDQARYDLDKLFNRKPEGAGVPPPPAP